MPAFHAARDVAVLAGCSGDIAAADGALRQRRAAAGEALVQAATALCRAAASLAGTLDGTAALQAAEYNLACMVRHAYDFL
jgi:hypothetical protein